VSNKKRTAETGLGREKGPSKGLKFRNRTAGRDSKMICTDGKTYCCLLFHILPFDMQLPSSKHHPKERHGKLILIKRM
jgi:hypothetical protein